MVLQGIGYSRSLTKPLRVKVVSWRRQHPAIFAHGSLFWSKNRSVLATPSRNLHSRRLCECSTIPNTLQNHAESPALDEYVLKMPLDIQIGSLGAKNDNFKVAWDFPVFFPFLQKGGNWFLDPLSSDVLFHGESIPDPFTSV